jgi:hypothetical protein
LLIRFNLATTLDTKEASRERLNSYYLSDYEPLCDVDDLVKRIIVGFAGLAVVDISSGT